MTNVVSLRSRKHNQGYEHDPIFFTKDQIRVGTVLIKAGRKRMSVWTVDRIVSVDTNGKRHPVEGVEKFADMVHMQLTGGSATRTRYSAGFGYLCYSVIWRVG